MTLGNTKRLTRRSFVRHSLVASAVATFPHDSKSQTPKAKEPNQYRLHFSEPALRWDHGLPVGNGRLGGMLLGGLQKERLQWNEETVWDGERRDRNNPSAGQTVARLRELLFAGRVREAETLANQGMLAVPKTMPNYETLGDLTLEFPSTSQPSSYRRELDLTMAIASVAYEQDGIGYRRELFSSAPDDIMILHLSADRPKSISFTAMLSRPAAALTTASDGNSLVMTGRALPARPGEDFMTGIAPSVSETNPGQTHENPVGVQFHAEVRFIAIGGTTKAQNEQVIVQGADSVTIYLVAATNFREKNPADRCATTLRKAMRFSFTELRQRHISDYRRLFERADIQLGSNTEELDSLATNRRLQRVREGDEDNSLFSLYYQFGRYLLISSSRPGTLAANLQGIWNDSIHPSWGSKYTTNINVEMNYWAVESANLSELHEPLFDLLDSTRGPGAITAKKYYSARGFVVHHNTDLWGDSAPIDGVDYGTWPMGAAWMATHLWEHYLFTGDIAFLTSRALPRLREISMFLLDYLTPSPEGYLVTGPSMSPENSFLLPDGSKAALCMGPAMDIEIARAVLECTLEAGRITKLSGDLEKQVETALARLPPLVVTSRNTIQEWPIDYPESEPGHRHISQLWGLYPGHAITVKGTPALANAARETIERRLTHGGGSTGWSRAWMVNCWARLEDGEKAHESLLALLRHYTLPNLLDICGSAHGDFFQIDANLGAPAGITEMLLQSSQSELRLLPALPRAWETGSLRGIRTRNGLEVSFAWRQGRITDARLVCLLPGRKDVIVPKAQKIVSVTTKGIDIRLERTPKGASFHAEAGSVYALRIFSA